MLQLHCGVNENSMESYQDGRKELPVENHQNNQDTLKNSSLRLAKMCAFLAIIGAFSTIIPGFLYSNVKPLQFREQNLEKDIPQGKMKTSVYPNIVFILADDMGYNSLSYEVRLEV